MATRRRYPEWDICKAYVQWFRIAHPKLYPLLLHVPNERSDPVQRRLLAAIGLRKGASDYFLGVPRGGWHGFWLEVKAPRNSPTDDQLEFMTTMQGAGYRACWAVDIDQAIALTTTYLKLPEEKEIWREFV